MLSAAEVKHHRQIAVWLLLCAGVIFAMILLGGVTRLTHSGLSMVEWKPLVGVIPPLTEADWQRTFAKYQQFPEYQQVNFNMDLAGFKTIFLFEYAHRVLGRLIGVIFLLPFLYFWYSGKLTRGLTPKLTLMFVLGGLQGLLGWYMVKSGLVDVPQVSQYRLTAHLGLAVLIYAYIVWVALGLLSREGERGALPPGLQRHGYVVSALLFVMILSGGLVAGTRAGLAYPTFPLMGDSFVPPGLYTANPVWMAAFEDITTIQFNHRMLAYLLVVIIAALVVRGLRWCGASRGLRVGLALLLSVLALQVSLGIGTLLMHVPVPLAAAHQGCAVLLLTCSLYVCHCLRAGAKQPAFAVAMPHH